MLTSIVRTCPVLSVTVALTVYYYYVQSVSI